MRYILAAAFILAAASAHAQVTPYQRAPLPAWVPKAAPPASQPNLLLNPPPASWTGQWRPEYGTMIMKPWER